MCPHNIIHAACRFCTTTIGIKIKRYLYNRSVTARDQDSAYSILHIYFRKRPFILSRNSTKRILLNCFHSQLRPRLRLLCYVLFQATNYIYSKFHRNQSSLYGMIKQQTYSQTFAYCNRMVWNCEDGRVVGNYIAWQTFDLLKLSYILAVRTYLNTFKLFNVAAIAKHPFSIQKYLTKWNLRSVRGGHKLTQTAKIYLIT